MSPLSQSPLGVLKLPGLHLDTLGHYFAALGLLRLTNRKWPGVKGCWRNGIFCLVGGPQNFTELEKFVLAVGANNEWTEYTQDWAGAQKKDTKNKNAINLALWKAQLTNEVGAIVLSSHIAIAERLNFNPVFGTGGNAGKRNFSKGWAKARDAVKAVDASSLRRGKKQTVAQPKALFKPMMPAKAKQDFKLFLFGEACILLGDYGAGCWFSAANKIYNFSPDKAFRDGQITPWAMLLACEAFPLLVGDPSRHMGGQRKGTGAFPFVTQGAAPLTEKEAGVVEGEFWAPVWGRPLSLPEVSALFRRGRAEANGRGALTAAAFATAIIQKGTDNGLDEFRRFSLLHTTSAQTFESRLASVHPMRTTSDKAQSTAVSRIIRFRDTLPRESQRGKSWTYRGLQGPIDNALVHLASAGNNKELRTEQSWKLLDAVFSSLEKTGNNIAYRERESKLELLPVSWAISLLESEHAMTPELRIALSLATLCADARQDTSYDKTTAPLIAYRIGVVPAWKNNWGSLKIAKKSPLRVVWGQRDFTENICAVIQRRLSVESSTNGVPPFNTQLTLPMSDIVSFLHKALDDALIERWLNRFMLFDWRFIASADRHTILSIVNPPQDDVQPLSSLELLHAFFRPLFHLGTFSRLYQQKMIQRDSQKDPERINSDGVTTTAALKQLVALLVHGDAAAAYSVGLNRYKSLLHIPIQFGENDFALDAATSQSLLAALLLPAPATQVVKNFSRWNIISRTV
jgi:CRISPR-associated protein Csx17